MKLTPEQIAVVLAGGTEIEVTDPTPAPAAGTPPAPAAASAPAATPAPAAPVAPSAQVIDFVQAQLAEANAKLVASQVRVAQLEAAAADSTAHLPALLEIAQASIGAMQVAMGASDTAKGMSAKDTVAEHARITPLFAAKFPGGRISAPPKEETPEAAVKSAAVLEFEQRMAAR